MYTETDKRIYPRLCYLRVLRLFYLHKPTRVENTRSTSLLLRHETSLCRREPAIRHSYDRHMAR